MNLNIKLVSRKKTMKLADIKVPVHFQNNQPKLDKILMHHQDYIVNGYMGTIIVDADDVIIDGYIPYLIRKSYGHENVTVYRITAKST